MKAARPKLRLEFERRLRFETLISELQARFLNADHATLDSEISKALRRLAKFLGLDQAILVGWGEDVSRPVPTHSWTAPRCKPVQMLNGKTRLAWTHRQTLAGKSVIFRDLDQLPPSAAEDKQFYRKAAIQGLIAHPLQASGRVIGALVLTSQRANTQWPEDTVRRLKLVADVFAGTIERERRRLELEEGSRFEALTAELSVSLINLPPDQVDHALEDAQRRFCGILGLDRSGLFQHFEHEDGALLMTHFYQNDKASQYFSRLEKRLELNLSCPVYWTGAGAKHPMKTRVDAKKLFPWIYQQLRKGQPVVISDLKELPKAAAADRRMFCRIGTKSSLVVPLSAGGSWLGCLTLAAVGQPRKWSETLTKRFRFLAHIFSNALMRKRADAALRQSEERFRQVAETVGDFIWEVDAQGLYTYASPSVEKILGYTPDELVGKVHFYELFVPAVRQRLKSAAFRVFADRRSFRAFPNPNVSKDGRIVHLETSGVAMVDQPGRLIGFRGVDTDVTDRLMAQEELRRSEQKFRKLHESMREAFVSVDMAGRLQEFNLAYQEMLGYSVEELRQMTYLELTPECWHEPEARIVRDQVLARDYSDVYEKEYRRKDGTVFPVSLRTFLIRDEAGAPAAMWALVRDITEAKRLEEVLRRNEERLRLILEANSEGIWDWDIPRGQAYFSPRYSEMLGYRPEEFAKNYAAWRALVHPDDLPRVDRAHQEHIQEGKEFCVELRMRKKTGDWCWIRSRGTVVERDAQGRATRMVGTHLDITARKEAEDRAQESERRFLLMANSAPVFIWASGPDKQCTFCNKSWLEFRGRTLQQELGEGWVEGIHPDDREACLKAYEQAFDARRPVSLEYRLRRYDGSYRWISDRGMPRYDAEQNFLGYIGSAVDITERKRAEAEAHHFRQELAHVGRVSTLGELAGSLAHELNQPLTSILSNAQAAQRFLDSNQPNLDELRSILEDIVQEDRRAGEVILRMRAMLKKGEAQMLPLELNALIREVLGLMRSELLVRNVTVTTRLAARLPLVRGDRVQVQQVVLNLVMNACDAMHSGPQGEARVLVETEHLAEGQVQVTVSDRGPGFTKEMLARPFEPFRTTKRHGLGLGLPLCRSIISAHGGRLWLANQGEGGAAVRFTLTIYREALT